MWEILVLIDGSALAMLIVSIFFVWNLYLTVSLLFFAFCFSWCHARYLKKKKIQYPLAPPKGKAGSYLPRTNIPRPIIAESREAEEEKKKLAKIRKMQNRKVARKRQ